MGRMEKVNQMMKKEIGNMIQQEIQDPRLRFVTVTHVDVSRDLHYARVNFSVLGDREQVVAAEKGLDGARGYIRRLIGQRISLRYTPEIEFIYDPSIEYSARIEKTLEDIKRNP